LLHVLERRKEEQSSPSDALEQSVRKTLLGLLGDLLVVLLGELEVAEELGVNTIEEKI